MTSPMIGVAWILPMVLSWRKKACIEVSRIAALASGA